jgi:hypothetical protein
MPILSKPYDALMQSADQILANPNAVTPIETPQAKLPIATGNPTGTYPYEDPYNHPTQKNPLGTYPGLETPYNPFTQANPLGLNPNYQMPQAFTDPSQNFNPADFGVSPYSYPSAFQSTPTWPSNLGPNDLPLGAPSGGGTISPMPGGISWPSNLGPNDLPVGLPYAPNRGPSLTPMAANVPTPDVVSNPFTNLPPVTRPSYGGNLFGNSGYAQNSAQGYNNPYGQANPGVYVNNFSQQPQQSQSVNPYQIYKQTLV